MKKDVLLTVVCVLSIIFVSSQTFNLRERYNRLSAVATSAAVQNQYLYSTGYCEDSTNTSGIMSYFCKHNVNGNLVNIRFFKIQGYKHTAIRGNKTVFTEDGQLLSTGYIIDSLNTIRCIIVKWDTNCNLVFCKEYSFTNVQVVYGLRLVATNSYFFIQGLVQFNNYNVNIFLLKTDTSGNELWRKFYGSNSTDERASAFLKTTDNRLLIAGQSNNRQYNYPHLFQSYSYLLLLDTAGNILRDTIGSDPNIGIPQSIVQTQDGNFVFCTDYAVSKGQWSGTYVKPYLAKIDSNLNLLWQYTYADSAPNTARVGFYDVKELSDGNLIAVGANFDPSVIPNYLRHHNGLIIKTNADGMQQWRREYRGVTRKGQQLEDNILYDSEILPDGSIIACGIAQDDNDTFPQQAWLLRIDADGCMDNNWCGYVGLQELPVVQESTAIRVYPNPASSSVTVSLENEMLNAVLKVYDVTGKAVKEFQVSSLPAGQAGLEFTVDISDLGKGLYIVIAEQEGKFARAKLVVE